MQSYLDEENGDYRSAEDEDFDPEKAAADAIDSSDNESTTPKSRNKSRTVVKVGDLDFDNSGDEVTLRKARGSKKRKTQHDDDGDGGDGGLIKTRAQRLVETKQPKIHAETGKPTVNVDDLWAQMSSTPPLPNSTIATCRETGTTDGGTSASEKAASALPTTETTGTVHNTTAESDPVNVTIKRIYEFAGKIEVEERVVPAHSAEAKLYLAEQVRKEEGQRARPASTGQQLGLRKPMKRKSMFAGTSTSISKDGDLVQGPKLNTLEKSKLDWAQQVDKEGIADELDEHSRAKDSYASRMEFLGRMDAKRDEGARSSRLA